MLRHRVVFVSVVVLASMVVPFTTSVGRASAQAAATTATAQDTSNDAAYKELVRAALAEFDGHRYEEARALFLRAHALSPSARTLRALGNVEFELRHYVKSVRYLRAALASREHPLTPEMQTEAQQALTRAQAYTGRFELDLQPRAAVLSIDGQAPEREADGALLLDIGRQELVLAAPGYATQHKVVTVQGGENERLQIVLTQGEVEGASSTTATSDTAPTSATRDEGTPSRSVLTKWWFWTAIGVVAAGTVTGIAIAASAGTETEAPLKGNLGESRMVLRVGQ